MSGLKEFKKENQENFKIGFLLELGFRQDLISRSLNDFINFLSENSSYFNVICLSNVESGISDFISLFYNFTDLIFKDVDSSESHCRYHKKFV